MKKKAKKRLKMRIQTLLSLFMCITLWLCNISYSFTALLPVTVVYNGKTLVSDVPPSIVQGRVYIPFRVLYEAIGATIEWNNDTKSIFATYGNHKMFLQVGNSEAYVNDQKFILDTPSFLQNGRVLVPARFVAESLEIDVKWDPINRRAILKSKDYQLAENSPTVTEPSININNQQNNNTTTTNIAIATLTPTPMATIAPTSIPTSTPLENTQNTTGSVISNENNSLDKLTTAIFRKEIFAYSSIAANGALDAQGNVNNALGDSIATISFITKEDFDMFSTLTSYYLRKLVYTSVVYRMDITQYRYIKVRVLYNMNVILQADINASTKIEDIELRDREGNVITK